MRQLKESEFLRETDRLKVCLQAVSLAFVDQQATDELIGKIIEKAYHFYTENTQDPRLLNVLPWLCIRGGINAEQDDITWMIVRQEHKHTALDVISELYSKAGYITAYNLIEGE